MHDRFSFVSLKQHLQWKLPSVPRPPSTLPSPADPQGFPGWTWRAGQRQKIPCRGLGGIPANQDQAALCEHLICLPRSSRAWLAVACEQLVAPCIAPTAATEPLCPPSPAVPRFRSSPACNESAESPWGRRGKSSSSVKIILDKK